MRRVYTASDLTLATLLLHRLEEHFIRARIFNEHMFSVRLEVPYEAALPQVWVEREQDYQRAKQLVAEFDALRHTMKPDTYCGKCGEENPGTFDCCWQCGESLLTAAQ